jgi:7-cyano-7-deazaguanine synthase
MRKISVCLFSGGIDSTVAATQLAHTDQNEVYLLSVLYNQGASDAEKFHSARVADWLMDKYPNVREHFFVDLGRSLRRSNLEVKNRHPWLDGFMGWRHPSNPWAQSGYPSTRDETFTLLAVAAAESRLFDGASAESAAVVLATNADDLANFGDLEPANFNNHLQAIVDGKLAPSGGQKIEISLPLINCTKSEVVGLGIEVGAPLHLSWSCYMGAPNQPCGKCDQCLWRRKAFADLGIDDPAMGNALARNSASS